MSEGFNVFVRYGLNLKCIKTLKLTHNQIDALDVMSLTKLKMLESLEINVESIEQLRNGDFTFSEHMK